MTIKEAKTLIKTKLEEKILELPEAQRIPVVYPVSIEDYILTHAIGTILIVYDGAEFKKKASPETIYQDRDMGFLVVPVIRFSQDKMAPEEWVDFTIDSLSGVEVDAQRPDRKIFAAYDDLIEEEKGVWTYSVTMVVPEVFIETKYRP